MRKIAAPASANGQIWRQVLAKLAVSLVFIMGLSMMGSSHATARKIRLVALGDSLTAGYLLPAAAAFPAKLEAALRARGHDVSVENAGVSGDTASNGLDRLAWSVPEGTDGVILELGANDGLRGIDPKITEATLETIILALKARGIAILFTGMLAPRNNGEPYIQQFDRLFPRLAAKHGLIFDPFFLEGVMGNEKLVLPDQMHPNAAGVEAIVARILPKVEALLASIRKS